MNDLRTAAQQALEALERYDGCLTHFHERVDHSSAITDLRAALAEPVQEPVAWHYTNNAGASVMHWGPSNRLDADMRAAKDYPHVHKVTPLYTQPPQRKPLTETEEEMQTIYREFMLYQDGLTPTGLQRVGRAIERAHGIL